MKTFKNLITNLGQGHIYIRSLAPGIGDVDCQINPDGRTITLLAPFRCCSLEGYSPAYDITVPVGFVSDMASVPRIFWNIIPPWGTYGPAAIAHDWLYRDAIPTRADDDAILLDLMSRLDTPWCERQAIYWAVRSWGWLYWKTSFLGISRIKIKKENTMEMNYVQGNQTSEYAMAKQTNMVNVLVIVAGLVATFLPQIMDRLTPVIGANSPWLAIAGAVVAVAGIISKMFVTKAYMMGRAQIKAAASYSCPAPVPATTWANDDKVI